ncbi:MAG: Gfo/Idh/MocA family oxidoreductase [Planctomycetes bacterium]|nr:Gfo/Idh/MocA family oxidoreductase [Planctomycetota bacterium]
MIRPARLRIGIVGFDHPHVLRYAPTLAAHPHVQLQWISENGKNRAPAEEMAKKLGCRWLPEPGDGVDAVYLANRPGGHRAAAERFAAAKIHILCDKPIALTLEDADAIVAAARKGGVHLMVPFNPRYQLGPQTIKQRIDAGEFGDVRMIHAVKCGKVPLAITAMDCSWFVDPKEAGFGGFGDIGIHALDAMRWWIGKKVKRVFAQIHFGPNPALKVDSIGTATIEWDGGAVSTLTAGWVNPPGFPSFLDARFEVVGTHCAATMDRPYAEFRVSDEKGTETIATWRPDIQGLVHAFVESVRADQTPPITGEDGREALAILLAAYRSSSEGQPVAVE